MKINTRNCFTILVFTSCTLSACVGPTHGPDKQFEGTVMGAASGAGSGAVTGFHVGAGTGPGALVGAGFGALAGGIKGALRDRTEENLLALARETSQERQRAMAHEILADHYSRRIQLHPTRDIYPADLFFIGDKVEVRPCARPLIEEIARLNKQRMSWSRLQVAVYTKASSKDSAFAQHLSEARSEAFGNYLVRSGVEPRRIETKPMVVAAPVLLDPQDDPGRYNQAIEIIPIDR
jgi:outer membrane protein OmpA-like peptidoglycan-associated protein